MANKNNSKKELKTAFIGALEKSLGVITVAAKSVGISRETVWRWMRDDPKFKASVESVNEVALDFVENKLFHLIRDDDTSAVIFYLRTKGKHRGYSERLDVAVSGEIELPRLRPKDIQNVMKNHSER